MYVLFFQKGVIYQLGSCFEWFQMDLKVVIQTHLESIQNHSEPSKVHIFAVVENFSSPLTTISKK